MTALTEPREEERDPAADPGAAPNPYASPSVQPEGETSLPQPEKDHSPWLWTPSLYFAEGFPYAVAMAVSVVLYKRLGFSNDEVAFYTSLLYLPWVVKPFWSPIVDAWGDTRRWILAMQLVLAAGMVGVAACIYQGWGLVASLAFFWLIAFASATHDMAADGFYMAGMRPRQQAWFLGIRSTSYRLGLIAGNGAMLIVAGWLEEPLGVAAAWGLTFAASGCLFGLLAAHHAVMLPRAGASEERRGSIVASMGEAVRSFFQKPNIVPAVCFLLFYRSAEAQLTKIAQPFLLDSSADGGLGLSPGAVGWLYGLVGVLMLVAGGIVGGFAGARYGLRRCMGPMVLALNVPNLVYVLMAWKQPTDVWTIGAAVGIEQLGYGFGFAAYMMYMLQLSRGEHQTAHYALCTGLMALGMMLPGLVCGVIQRELGYFWFFVWVMAATAPSFLVSAMVTLDEPADAEADRSPESTMGRPITEHSKTGKDPRDSA